MIEREVAIDILTIIRRKRSLLTEMTMCLGGHRTQTTDPPHIILDLGVAEGKMMRRWSQEQNQYVYYATGSSVVPHFVV